MKMFKTMLSLALGASLVSATMIAQEELTNSSNYENPLLTSSELDDAKTPLLPLEDLGTNSHSVDSNSSSVVSVDAEQTVHVAQADNSVQADVPQATRVARLKGFVMERVPSFEVPTTAAIKARLAQRPVNWEVMTKTEKVNFLSKYIYTTLVAHKIAVGVSAALITGYLVYKYFVQEEEVVVNKPIRRHVRK